MICGERAHLRTCKCCAYSKGQAASNLSEVRDMAAVRWGTGCEGLTPLNKHPTPEGVCGQNQTSLVRAVGYRLPDPSTKSRVTQFMYLSKRIAKNAAIGTGGKRK